MSKDIMSIDCLVQTSKEIANKHGWKIDWFHVPTYLMLVVTELAEAMEAYRDDSRNHFEEEIADCFIRLAHLCGDLDIPITEVINWKMAKNSKRPYKHGRKRL